MAPLTIVPQFVVHTRVTVTYLENLARCRTAGAFFEGVGNPPLGPTLEIRKPHGNAP
jgi:hypothetical protein